MELTRELQAYWKSKLLEIPVNIDINGIFHSWRLVNGDMDVSFSEPIFSEPLVIEEFKLQLECIQSSVRAFISRPFEEVAKNSRRRMCDKGGVRSFNPSVLLDSQVKDEEMSKED